MATRLLSHRLLDMHEIKPRLFLGSSRSAADSSALAEHGITHVLSVCKTPADIGHRQRVRVPASEEDACTRLLIAVDDVTSARLDRHFDACCAFILEGLEEGAVLVHCQAGQSRSPTVVIAYLMREERWTAVSALRFVQKKRAKVQPNLGFMDQLRSLEVHLSIKEGERSVEIEETANTEAAEATHSTTGAGQADCAASKQDAQVDSQVEACDPFGVAETRKRCERLRSRCQRLRAGPHVTAASRKRHQ
jgi:protein-tyrosine phosphatase